jgi:hypothetical protein
MQLPNDTKYHIIATDPIIDQPKYLHHIVVYGCSDDFDQSKIGTSEECSTMNKACATFMIGWAPGQGRVDYPVEAGFPIGTGSNAVKYFAMQVHYNNVDNDEGKVDNSGMRLTYTPRLRPNDLGVLNIGDTQLNLAPGNSSVSTRWNVCPGECTSQFPTDLTVVSFNYHMHRFGRQIATRIVRNGVELPNVKKDYYDYNYQGSSLISAFRLCLA